MTTGTFYSKVAGVTAANDDGQPRQTLIRAYARAGMPVTLKREPENRFDKNAVACWIKARDFLFFTSEVQIGYLPAETAGEISRAIAGGRAVQCSISEVTGGSGKKRTFGVNLLIQKG